MRYASIDIGTNTLRLLIAEPAGNGGIVPIVHKRAITRLGGNFSTETGIDVAAADRTFAALAGFKKAIDENSVDSVRATATSAVRRAVNGQWFVSEVMRRTGIAVNVIQGDEEARLSLLGVLSVLRTDSEKRLVFDIGGGSTEFIAVDEGGMAGAWSMEMGVVHLSEKYLRSDPPSRDDVAGLDVRIKTILTELKSRMTASGVSLSQYSGNAGAALVGTAGTITTLAALDQDLEVYDRGRINNYRLRKRRIRAMYERLLSMGMAERTSVLSLEKGREDLIIPGSAITLQVMEEFGFDEVTVSDAGLLEGIIIDRLRG